MSTDASTVIPVMEEAPCVQKRVVESGSVTISKQVHEHEEVIDEPLRYEQAVVERHPVNQRVETAPPIRREGATLIIPLVEEVLVVEKQLFLKEEVHIILQQTEVRQSQTVKLRREEAIVKHAEPLQRKEE